VKAWSSALCALMDEDQRQSLIREFGSGSLAEKEKGKMKNLVLLMLMLAAIHAPAQTPTVTTPQSVTSKNFFNAVFAATTSKCLSNLGQTVHIASYTTVGAPTAIQFRLEYSFNSDAATCSTGTWFPMSDDSTDTTQGEVIGIGTFPFVRANLLVCAGCSAGVNTLTASYSGTSAMPGVPFGFYGAGQQIRKVAFINQSVDGSATSSSILTPYGSSAGFLVITGNFTGAGGGSFTVVGSDFAQTADLGPDFSTPSANITVAVPVPATSTTSVSVHYATGGPNGNTFSVYYYFYPPGNMLPPSAQPAFPSNTEATAVNATVTTTLSPPGGAGTQQRAHLFSVSARCSAGTAQLLVKDGTTAIWSSAATEVGVTTFKYQWNPGLAGSVRNNLVITLSTCGALNTGTLDVQGSIF
jgi:hypothetical protein